MAVEHQLRRLAIRRLAMALIVTDESTIAPVHARPEQRPRGAADGSISDWLGLVLEFLS
jgi:hypothetical protein